MCFCRSFQLNLFQLRNRRVFAPKLYNDRIILCTKVISFNKRLLSVRPFIYLSRFSLALHFIFSLLSWSFIFISFHFNIIFSRLLFFFLSKENKNRDKLAKRWWEKERVRIKKTTNKRRSVIKMKDFTVSTRNK